MDNTIRNIRAFLQMTIPEFAEALDTTAETIDTWEKTNFASEALQVKLSDFCRAKNVPVYDIILDGIQKKYDSIEVSPSQTLLFHGSKSGIQGRIEPKSRDICDFGAGFYMGTLAAQVLTLICNFDKPKLYYISLDTSKLETLAIPISIEWAFVIAYHRKFLEDIKRTPLYERYENFSKGKDLLIGTIANDRLYVVIDDFLKGAITDQALIHSLSALTLGKQFVAITQKACDAVCVKHVKEISSFERGFIMEAASQNRELGRSLAGEICKKYRREGRYFDEIISDMLNGGEAAYDSVDQ